MLDEAIVEVEKAYSEANRLVTAPTYQEVRKAEIIRDEAAKKEAEKFGAMSRSDQMRWHRTFIVKKIISRR